MNRAAHRPVRGAILAGGTARRFGGGPKGLEKVGGERILDRVVRVVQAAVGSAPLLIANAQDADQWNTGLTVTRDLIPDCGTMSGLYTAVAHSEHPVLILAWDMPFVPVALLETLIARADGFDVFLPESNGPSGVEPLCGVYNPSSLAAMTSAMAEGDYRATGFHAKVNVGTLSLSEVTVFGIPEMIFFNVNSPAELERAEELWRNKRE
jgi:molybdenum cofactor guanylyltransferase